MRILELFCGTKSISKVFEKYGCEVVSVDIEERFNPTICCNVLELDYKMLGNFDFIWASPPCVSYSNMGGGKHRAKITFEPLTDTAVIGDMLLNYTLEIIDYFGCMYCIENPRGGMRHILQREYTPLNYCKYGSQFFKPTDIFNNIGFVGKLCKYERKGKIVDCHHQRIGGSHKNRVRGGIQRATQEEAYAIPPALVEEIYTIVKSLYYIKP